MIVKCTSTTTMEITVSHQERDDPEDGTRKGFYAWVGPPDDQSDFAVGPFATKKAAEDGALVRLKRHGYTVRKAAAKAKRKVGGCK